MTILRALIVEDSEDDSLLVREALRSGGYDVHFVRVETEEALRRALRDEPWDIVLSDYSLPSFDARDTLTILRESGVDTPVIVVSGTVGEEVAVETLKLGAHDYLLKQSLTRLVPAVAQVLSNAENRRLHRKAERMRRLILENSLDIICSLDTEGRFLEISAAVETVLGYEPAALTGTRFVALVHDGDAAFVVDQFKTVLRGDRLWDLEARLIHKAGHAVHTTWSIAISMADGVIVGVGRDITERKRKDAALREERDFSNAVLNSLPGVFYQCDDHGRYLRWNRNHELVTGYSGDEIARMHPLDFIPDEEKATVESRIAEVFTKGESRVEANYLLKDGRRVPYVFTGVRFEHDGRKSFVGIGLDIEARKRMEEALRESEQRYHNLVQMSPDGIFLHDGGVTTFVNAAGLQMLRARSAEHVIGRPPHEIFHPDCHETLRQRLDILLCGPGSLPVSEETMIAQDGTEIPVEVHAVSYLAEGRLIVQAVCRDITERKEKDEALRRIEDAIRRERALLRSLIDSIPDLVFFKDKSFHFLGCNRTFENYLGVAEQQIIGKTDFDIVPEEWARHYRSKDEMLFATAHPQRIEEQIPSRDGRTGIFDTIKAPFYGPDGELLGLLGVSRDIADRKHMEAALRQERDFSDAALNSLPGAFYHFDDSGRFLRWNQNFERVTGYSAGELAAMQALDFFGDEDKPLVASRIAEVYEKGESQVEAEFLVKDGRRIPYLFTAVRFEQNGRSGFIGVALDISWRKHIEQRLREERDYADAVINTLPGIFYHYDADLRLVRWNRNFEHISGYSPDELAGIHPLTFFAEEERALVADRIREVFERGESQVEADYLLKDGRRIPYLFTGVRFEQGGRHGFIGVGTDIENLKRMEDALREETAMLEAQVESSLDGILVVDRHGKKFIQNQRLTELWKIPPAIADDRDHAPHLDFSLTRVKAPDEVAATMAWLNDHPEGVIRSEVELVDGTLLDRYSAPVHDKEGRYYGRIWSFRDITAQRRAEEQKAALEAQLRQHQKLDALGTLAGGIAHDFNNILTAIIANRELALMDLHDPAALRPLLDEIGQAGSRAKELVRQILTFSRKQKPERRRQHLLMIVAEAVALVRASLPSTIAIQQDLSPETPPVLADAGQIHQVVMNLCTNAAHAMRGRPGRLTVRLAAHTLDEAACRAFAGLSPGRYAQITIVDTGSGMEPEVLARIFEPFFTTKGPGEGTGLGLAMVHGIVRDHDGGIAVHSQPGAGTTFEIYFPEATETDTPAWADPSRLSGRGESILVVDDEKAIGRVISTILRRMGYRVETFDDPRAALERLLTGSTAFDLLLTDHTMPHLTGPELIAQARAALPHLPALVMSGLNARTVDEQTSGREYGLLAKPIDIAELSRSVRQALAPPVA